MENRRPKFVARAGRNRKRLQFEIDLKEIHHNGFYNSCNKKWHRRTGDGYAQQGIFKCQMLIAEPPKDEKAERFWRRNYDVVRAVFNEDFEIGENIQKGNDFWCKNVQSYNSSHFEIRCWCHYLR